MKAKIFLIGIAVLTISLQKTAAQVKSIKIGNQVWMAQNLNIDIPGSFIYNGNQTIEQSYGRLYTWEAAKNACPASWHLPTDGEWTELVNTVGGEDIAGKQLKPTGGTGFNAPLGGYADGHSFWFINVYGGYWTSSSYDDQHAWYRYFTKKDDSFTKTYFSKNYGFSVRCIKNQNYTAEK
jgi:uncharacterized protein (TIGR02145 family)